MNHFENLANFFPNLSVDALNQLISNSSISKVLPISASNSRTDEKNIPRDKHPAGWRAYVLFNFSAMYLLPVLVSAAIDILTFGLLQKKNVFVCGFIVTFLRVSFFRDDSEHR